MKKTITLIAALVTLAACNKTNDANVLKTAYIDTVKLMEESTEARDIEAKYKEKSKVMGSQLEVEAANLDAEKKSFQANMQKNGEAWAQRKYAELQERAQRLNYAEQGMMQQLQQESGVEMDSIKKAYRKIIKDFGKEKGYDYVYGTGDAASILYAKDSYDVTKDIIKLVNDKYKSSSKKEEDKTDKKEEKK
jgi:outer membrane protein